MIRDYWEAGVRHLVALRGDPPGQIGGAYAARADGYANATELVAGIRAIAPFEVSVGLYPQTHPESPSAAHDIDVLKAKIDAGRHAGDHPVLLRRRRLPAVHGAGAGARASPFRSASAIMPVSNFKGLRRMAAPCGIPLPGWMGGLFDGLDEDPETRRLIASSVAAEMCAKLVEEGFDDFHFYTLNRADLVYAICRVLGVRETAR